ncbi:MAG: signal peptidase II [Treponema sp.]|nr:signal peptidase II [Treponema sp.]
MKLKPKFDRERCLPFLLTALVVFLDQCSKWLISSKWPIGTRIWPAAEAFSFDNFLQIVHVRNTAIAFSIGHGFPDPLKRLLFVLLPVLVLAALVWYYLSSSEFTKTQRWAVAGILGGGIGNIVDRIFRPEGVVDFVSVRFYGIFGFERWPTFNVADASVVTCCLLLLLTMLFPGRKSEKSPATTAKQETP